MEEQNIGKRLSILMQAMGCKAADFARQVNIRPSNVSHIVNGRSDPSCKLLQSIFTQFPTVNPDWLILGQGSMFRSQPNGHTEEALPTDSLFAPTPVVVQQPAEPDPEPEIAESEPVSEPAPAEHTHPNPTRVEETPEERSASQPESNAPANDEFGDILILRKNGTYIRYREGRE